ncbi:MAG: hypothetical protein V4751_06160 [Pseudomonadota bacterium]
MSDLQIDIRNVAVTPALTSGQSAEASSCQDGRAASQSEHLYLIDQFDEDIAESDAGEIILWGDVFVDTRHPQRLC